MTYLKHFLRLLLVNSHKGCEKIVEKLKLSVTFQWLLMRPGFFYVLSAMVLFPLLTITGCTDRHLIRPTNQMDAKPRFWVRVLLYDDIKKAAIETESGFGIIDPATGTESTHFSQSGMPIGISISKGSIFIANRPFKGQIIILPDSPHIFSLNGNKYRGKLRLVPNADGSSFDAINYVPLEPYLAGVVGAEMPDYWEPAALQAQTIAARTYCLFIKRRFGKNRTWDLKRTQAHQVYKGLSVESASIWDAVDKTYGRVMICKQPDGREDLFPAYYSSTCGGHTENSRNVFGDQYEPLIGVPCPYCINVAKPRFFSWPMVKFEKDYVSDKLIKKYPKLKPLGKIEKIIVVGQSDYGKFSRLTKIKLLGSNKKTGFLRAEDLRLTIDPTGRKLKSTMCQIVEMGDKWAFISGRGYGHGVGMCQCGAEGMARTRKKARQILSYYYPNSKIISIY